MFKILIDEPNNEQKKQHTVYIYGDRSLLSELEDEHIMLNHNCRQGHCGRCILNLVHGEVRHQESLVPLAQGEILACQCMPTSDLHVAMR